MADKRKKPDPDLVTIKAAAGFKHDGRYIRTGETVEVSKAEANDLVALNMARLVEVSARG